MSDADPKEEAAKDEVCETANGPEKDAEKYNDAAACKEVDDGPGEEAAENEWTVVDRRKSKPKKDKKTKQTKDKKAKH